MAKLSNWIFFSVKITLYKLFSVRTILIFRIERKLIISKQKVGNRNNAGFLCQRQYDASEIYYGYAFWYTHEINGSSVGVGGCQLFCKYAKSRFASPGDHWSISFSSLVKFCTFTVLRQLMPNTVLSHISSVSLNYAILFTYIQPRNKFFGQCQQTIMVVWLEMLKYSYVKTNLANFPIQQQQELFVISNSSYLTKTYVQIFQYLKNVDGNKNGCVCGNLVTCSKEMSKKHMSLKILVNYYSLQCNCAMRFQNWL